jgi:D-alanyl-D-alanine carboxypeptidase
MRRYTIMTNISRRDVLRLGTAGAIMATTGIALVGSPAQAAIPKFAPSSGRPAQDPGLQPLLDKVVAAGAPGIIAQIHTPTQSLSPTSGVADRDAKIPMTPDMHFRVGSAAKSFVATVVLQLVDEGALRLDDPVSRWVPWPPKAPAQCQAITVRHLLQHRSGLFNFTDDLGWMFSALSGQIFKPQRLVEIATTNHPLNFAPGTRCKYSNTDYIVAGMIIEKITRSTLGNQLGARIFQRLGLRNTGFPTSTAMPNPHTKGYFSRSGVNYRDLTTKIHPSAYWAAGASVSNATDLGEFFRALLGGRLLPPHLLEAMKETVVDDKGVEWGLGIAREVSQCGHMWGHGGSAFGYYTPKACSSEDGTRSAVIMINSFLAPDSILKPLKEAVSAVMCHALLDHMPAEAKTATPDHLTQLSDDPSRLAEIVTRTQGPI